MKTIIRIVGLADGRPSDVDGLYLAGYDNTRENELGVGVIDCFADRDLAQRFDDFAAAVTFWKQVSLTVPIRPDGKPNRPLTGFTVTFEHVA